MKCSDNESENKVKQLMKNENVELKISNT